jgi:hypothetical protein
LTIVGITTSPVPNTSGALPPAIIVRIFWS